MVPTPSPPTMPLGSLCRLPMIASFRHRLQLRCTSRRKPAIMNAWACDTALPEAGRTRTQTAGRTVEVHPAVTGSTTAALPRSCSVNRHMSAPAARTASAASVARTPVAAFVGRRSRLVRRRAAIVSAAGADAGAGISACGGQADTARKSPVSPSFSRMAFCRAIRRRSRSRTYAATSRSSWSSCS